VYRPQLQEFEPPFGAASCVARKGDIGVRHGCSEEKNLPHEAWPASLGRCAGAPDLCRGQGFGRAAPPAPHRPEDGHVSRPPSPQSEERLTTRILAPVRGGMALRGLAAGSRRRVKHSRNGVSRSRPRAEQKRRLAEDGSQAARRVPQLSPTRGKSCSLELSVFNNRFCNLAWNVIDVHSWVTMLACRVSAATSTRKEMPTARDFSRAILV
jgi:hypothetical protein